jgi:hypothetical protein
MSIITIGFCDESLDRITYTIPNDRVVHALKAFGNIAKESYIVDAVVQVMSKGREIASGFYNASTETFDYYMAA